MATQAPPSGSRNFFTRRSLWCPFRSISTPVNTLVFEATATFVEPQYGDAIRLSPFDGSCEVIQKVRATGVPPDEGPGVL